MCTPNNNENIEVKNTFYEKLEEITDKIGGTRENVMKGDFKIKTGFRKKDVIVGELGENVVEDNGVRLIELCSTYDLKNTNCFYILKDTCKYSKYQSIKQLKTFIYYLVIKQRTELKLLEVTVRGVECGSDHFMVRARLTFLYTNNLI